MAGTFTLTGRFKHNDGVTPWVNSTIRYASSPYPDTTDDTVYYSQDTIVTDANGAFSITLVTETSLFYIMTSDDNLFTPNPFTFAAPAAGSTRDVTDLAVFDPSTITSSIATAAAASAAAAAASAASVNREGNSGVAGLDANGLPIRSVPLWRASTVFATGQVVEALNSGALLKRTAGGTSRASFDATEAALWTPVTGAWDVRTFGAVGDGTTDDAAAINAAAAAALSGGGRVAGTGTFKIGSTVTIACDADLASATFNYTGTTIGVNVGTTTSAANIFRLSVKLPDVVFTNKPATGWTASTTGVRLVNLVASDVAVGRISGFEDGLTIQGIGAGSAWNTITPQHLDNNKRNIRFTADATGFANQNTFLGGRCSHNSSEGTQVAGVRHVLMDSTTNIVNNNTFVGTSLETPNVVEYHIETFGWDNVWANCRWENTTVANTRVFWRANTRGNLILYGFGSYSIVEVVEAGNASTQNSVIHRLGQRMFSSGTAATTAGLLLENINSSASPVARVMPAGSYTASSDPTTAYTWEWTSQSLTGKRTGDATSAPRVVLDGVSGVVRVTRAVTGSRPAAGTAGAGAMFLDSTLNKPIWSDGTNWRDATGAIV